MRLTMLLGVKMPKGHIYRGKYRLVKEVTKEDLKKIRVDLNRELENMFYFKHPYLTEKQSHGHAQALGKPEERDLWLRSQKRPMKPNIKYEDCYAHLRVQEPWDV